MNLEIFKNDNFEIRVAVGEVGDPLFCLADVCRVLEIQNVTDVKNAIKREFDDGIDLTYPIFDSLGREQNATFVTEPQLYFVLMRSDKPNARSFRKWVNVEVLPSIRKHGGYLTQKKIDEVLSDPDTIIKLALDLKAQRAKTQELEREKAANLPYITFAKAVEASATSINIGDYAKALCDDKRIRVGQKRLFSWLRDSGYLQKDNKPYQKYVDNGYFELVMNVIATTKGNLQTFTTKITSKRQVALAPKIEQFFSKSA